MYFNTSSKSNDQLKLRLINANSWSNCLSYLEGTGETIQSINLTPDTVSVIVNEPTSEICYSITLKDNQTGVLSNYLIVDDSFVSIQTWLSQQTDKTPTYITQQQKSYTTV